MNRKKIRFVAEAPSYSLTIKNNAEINTLVKTNANDINKETTIDTLDINLKQLLVNLKNNINKKPSWTIFLRVRENVKIGLTNDKIELLIEQISKIRRMGREFLELQADAICSKELLDLLVEDKINEFKFGVILKLEEHKSKVHTHQISRKKEKLEVIGIELDHAYKQAQIDLLKAETKEQIQDSRFIEVMIEQIKKMSDGAKLSLWHDFMNRKKQTINTSPERDFDMNEFFKDYRKQIFGEEVIQKKAETKTKKAEAEFNKYNADKKMGKL